MTSPVVASVRGLTVEFPGVRALDTVDLDVRQGEILGLVGENGAGKSTLIKVWGGTHGADRIQGQVQVLGRSVAFAGPSDSQRAGIAVVHQELSLVNHMTVAENLLLGSEPGRWGLADRERTVALARDALLSLGAVGTELGGRIDLEGPVSQLGVGDQQLIEIARALFRDARLIILDEPTAALSDREAAALFDLVRARRDAGTSFVFVSHRLPEVLALTDRVAVLRDGSLAGVLPTEESTEDDLVAWMTGARPRLRAARRGVPGAVLLEVRELSLVSRSGRRVLRDVSMAVRAGEIVGLAGSVGAGRTALLSTLFGLARGAVSGRILVGDKPTVPKGPRHAMALGLFLLPEDRKGAGVVLTMGVADNIHLSSLSTRFLDGPRLEQCAVAASRVLSIKAASLASPVQTLSGGNQQKVAMARGLATGPDILLLDEPTRGVDVGARGEMYELIRDQASLGKGVVFASSDLQELEHLADRIVVMRDGACVGDLSGDEATDEAIVRLSVGAAEPEPRTDWCAP